MATLLLQFFREIPFFRSLTDDQLENIIANVQTKKFELGAIIFQQGDIGDGMYIIMCGQVEVSINNEKITTFHNNDFFGEMALMSSDSKRTATIQVAKAPMAAFFLSREIFNSILDILSEEVQMEMFRRIIENQDAKRG